MQYKKIRKFIKIRFLFLLHFVFRIFPIDEKKIVICNYYGRGYGDNAKYIVEELLKQEDNYKIIWLCNDIEEKMPSKITKVKYNSISSIRDLVTAKIWIDNSRKQLGVLKRKDQYYIQTWHSPLRLKKIEKDAGESLSKSYIKKAKKDGEMTDLMISGCDFSWNIYRNSFWYDGEILKCGTPRCDLFFEDSGHIKEKVYQRFNIPESKKIVVFAPTFRNSSEIENYNINYEEILLALSKKFGDEWCMLFRLHPNVAKLNSNWTFNDQLIDATFYEDMQELLCSAEILITDYSSCMFDMAIAQKKCFIYAKDIQSYLSNERKLYFKTNELPFEFSTTSEELIQKISVFDENEYKEKLQIFNCKIGNYESGKASNAIILKINEVLGVSDNNKI